MRTLASGEDHPTAREFPTPRSDAGVPRITRRSGVRSRERPKLPLLGLLCFLYRPLLGCLLRSLFFFAGFATFFVVFLAIFFFAAAFFGLAGAGPEATTARAGASPETGVGGDAFALAATA